MDDRETRTQRRPGAHRTRLASMALALVVAACSGDAGETTTTTPPDSNVPTTTTTPAAATTTTLALPRHGGEAVVGLDLEPPTLNPFLPGGTTFSTRLIGNALWTGVSRVDGATLEAVPDVVEELPTLDNGGIEVADDGSMTVRYRILEEAVWADGTPISGDDFLFTYETIMDPDLPIVDRTTYEDILPDSLQAGPKTFEFAMAAPTLAVEGLFDVILPRHDVEGRDFASAFDREPWVSGGPFVFETWQQGAHLRVARNDNYWRTDADTGDQLPFLDAIEFRFQPEVSSMVGDFRTGSLDVIQPPPLLPTIDTLGDLEGVTVHVAPGAIWEHLSFSFSENSLVRNPGSYNAHLEYRQAVAHALDMQAIVDDVFTGLLTPSGSYLDTAPWASTSPWARYEHDPERARSLITDLCAKPDVDCEAEPPTAVLTTTSGAELRPRVVDLIVPMLEEVGITVVVDLEPSTTFFGPTLDSGAWDLGIWAYVAPVGLAAVADFHRLWAPSQAPPEGSNTPRWGTPAVRGAGEPFDQGPSLVVDDATDRAQQLWDALATTVDTGEVLGLVREFEALLADNVVFVPLFSRPDVLAVRSGAVGGVVPNPTQSGFTWNVAQWYRIGEADS